VKIPTLLTKTVRLEFCCSCKMSLLFKLEDITLISPIKLPEAESVMHMRDACLFTVWKTSFPALFVVIELSSHFSVENGYCTLRMNLVSVSQPLTVCIHAL